MQLGLVEKQDPRQLSQVTVDPVLGRQRGDPAWFQHAPDLGERPADVVMVAEVLD